MLNYRYCSIILSSLIVAYGTTPIFANDIPDRGKMEQSRQKLQTDIRQMKVDQQKLSQDREQVRQDRMEMMRLRQDMMRDRMNHKMDIEKKITVPHSTSKNLPSPTHSTHTNTTESDASS